MSGRNDDPSGDTTDQVTRLDTHSGNKPFVGEDEHPLPEQVAAFARGELAGDDGAAVERHLLACDRCAALLVEPTDDQLVAALRRAHRAPTVGDLASFSIHTNGKKHAPAPTVPGYELLGELGRGAMGVVYKARHLQLNRLAAVKMIVGGRYHDPAARIRFAIEAEAVAALDHPNVVHVHEFGTHEELPFFVLEYVAGGSLAEKLTRDGKPTARAAAGLVVKLADGVAAAHAKGIVHRDLKPANVLLTASGEPKVADFGLAKVSGSDLTATGAVMGTPSYMSPEQAAGRARDVGTPSDVYALGAVLYELLTGRPPFQGGSVMDTLEQVRTREPVRPRAVDVTIPRDLETICLKCLQKSPAHRYGAATELGADLRAYLEGRPIIARPVGPIERAAKWARRNTGIASGAAFGVLALLTGTVVALAQAGVAKEEARRANEAASNESTQKQIAEDNASKLGVALGEKTRAESAVSKKAADLENALRDKSAAEAAESKKAAELAVQLKEMRRVLDLSKLREARTAFDNNQVQLARDTLAEIAPENRCLVWGLLNRRFDGSLFTLKHATAVSDAAISAYGSRIVTGSDDGVVRVWDGRTGDLLHNFQAIPTGYKASLCMAVSADGSRVITTALIDKRFSARVWDGRTGRPLLELKITGAVTCMAVSDDGTRIVTGTADGTGQVWDAKTGLPLCQFKGLKDRVVCLAANADASRVVTVSPTGVPRMWDGRNGQALLDFKGDGRSVTSVAMSAAGSLVVTGSKDTAARVWSGQTAQLLLELKGHAVGVTHAAVSADGSRIVTADHNGIARVWDAKTGQPFLDLKGDARLIATLAISADGARVVAGSYDGVARAWDTRADRLTFALTNHASSVQSAVMNADGSRLVTAAAFEKTAWVWHPKSGKPVTELKGHAGTITSVATSADGSRIVTGSEDMTARVWDGRTGQSLLELKGHTNHVTGVAMSADGSRIVTAGSWENLARVWDGRTGQSLLTLKGDTRSVESVAMSADGSRVITAGSQENTAWIWDARTGQSLYKLGGHTGRVYEVAMSANGSRAVTCSWDGTARVWDTGTGQTVTEITGLPGITHAAVNADGSRILTCQVGDATVRVWDAATAQPLLELAGDAGATHVAASADGARVVVCSTKSGVGTGQLWDTQVPKPSLELWGHAGEVLSVAVSADGARVVTGSRDRTARVWDAKTGRIVAELKGHTEPVWDVGVSADGARVVTGSYDGTTRVWDVSTGRPLAEREDGYREGHKGEMKRAGGRMYYVPVSPATTRDAVVIDFKTGQSIPDRQGVFFPESVNRTPDGKFMFVRDKKRVLKVPVQLDSDERARLLEITRPNPGWHTERHKDFLASGNTYGAALHRSLEHTARGTLALEAGDLSGAWGHFIAAAALKPAAPKLE